MSWINAERFSADFNAAYLRLLLSKAVAAPTKIFEGLNVLTQLYCIHIDTVKPALSKPV